MVCLTNLDNIYFFFMNFYKNRPFQKFRINSIDSIQLYAYQKFNFDAPIPIIF